MLERKNGEIFFRWKNPGDRRFEKVKAVYRQIDQTDWIVVSSSVQSEIMVKILLLAGIAGLGYAVLMILIRIFLVRSLQQIKRAAA